MQEKKPLCVNLTQLLLKAKTGEFDLNNLNKCLFFFDFPEPDGSVPDAPKNLYAAFVDEARHVFVGEEKRGEQVLKIVVRAVKKAKAAQIPRVYFREPGDYYPIRMLNYLLEQNEVDVSSVRHLEALEHFDVHALKKHYANLVDLIL